MEAATYGLYLLITLPTLAVAAMVSRHTGRMLLTDVYDGDQARASTVSTALAVFIGLFNLAVIALTINAETPLTTGDQVFDAIATRFGRATVLIAILFGAELLILLGARNNRANARSHAQAWAMRPMPTPFVPMMPPSGPFGPGPFGPPPSPFGGLPGAFGPPPPPASAPTGVPGPVTNPTTA